MPVPLYYKTNRDVASKSATVSSAVASVKTPGVYPTIMFLFFKLSISVNVYQNINVIHILTNAINNLNDQTQRTL